MKPTLQKSVKWPGCAGCYYFKVMASKKTGTCKRPKRVPPCAAGLVYKEGGK